MLAHRATSFNSTKGRIAFCGSSEGVVGVTRYVARRLVMFVPILFVLSMSVFTVTHFTPGDPVARLFVGHGFADPAAVQQIRGQLGLDLPVHEQYLRWLFNSLHGDFGSSIITRQPVREALLMRLPVTLELSVFAMAFAILISAAVMISSALWRWRWLDTLTTTFVLSGVAIPPYLLGILLILLFSERLNWLPPAGYTPFSTSPIDNLRLMILPTVTLGMSLALIPRMTQVAVTDVLRREFAVVARAKGLPEWRVVLQHALPNALVPIISVISLETGTILGGVVLTEVIFAMPGLGRLIVENILAHDYPLVQGTVLLLALTRVTVNLVADMLYGLVDPRIRVS